jgi:hypothetical protein
MAMDLEQYGFPRKTLTAAVKLTYNAPKNSKEPPRVVVDEKKTITIPAGGSAPFKVEKAFPGLAYDVKTTDDGSGQKSVTVLSFSDLSFDITRDNAPDAPPVYHYACKFGGTDKSYLQAQPRAIDLEASVKFNPANNKLELSGDTVDAKIPAGSKPAAMSYAIEKDGVSIASGRIAQISNLIYTDIVELPSLPSGKYQVADSLVDAGGKVLVSRKDLGFEKKDGGIPTGTGTVWDSTSLATFKDGLIPTKDWKSFAPVIFVGTGSRGLWFYAWSDKGWQLADGDAALRIERDAKTGAPTLRVRMIAGGTTLDTPRTIRFALLAAPVKPLPADYRNWKMSHDTAGYRWYGDSVDGYVLPDDEAYEMERKRLLYGPQTEFAREWYGKRGWGVATGRNAILNNQPVVLYGSGQLTGAGMAEFDTFRAMACTKTMQLVAKPCSGS